jgi:hypothetical protein
VYDSFAPAVGRTTSGLVSDSTASFSKLFVARK